MNQDKRELRRQIVCAVAAQRSRVITSADVYGQKLRGLSQDEDAFNKRIWSYATAIVEAEPDDSDEAIREHQRNAPADTDEES